MSAKKSTWFYIFSGLCILPFLTSSAETVHDADTYITNPTLTSAAIAKQLGWISSPENICGGYYLDEAFAYTMDVEKDDSVEITSGPLVFSQRGTSIAKGNVTITRQGQQVTTNKAYLYRDPETGKLNAIDMIGNVHLREPNTLVVAKQGHYNLETKTKSLRHILYRTALNLQKTPTPRVTNEEMQQARKVTALTAWGRAYEFSQTEPKIYELSSASFSTCPPNEPAWKVKASHIVLNKITGRGYATHARFLIRDVPVLYFPYINFSIDGQRKTGFLWPTMGVSDEWGPYLLAPLYLNLAPNYDMTLTTGLLTKRGIQLNDRFRYLTPYNEGRFDISVLPNDQLFQKFQEKTAENTEYSLSTNPATRAELRRLLNTSPTRKAFVWQDDALFNKHWSSHVDFNYAGDDYYLRDFGSNLNEITQNQLLQEGDLYYKSKHWNFTGRVQAYQTLHPINESMVQNVYRRLPQLLLDADYPNQPFGLEYFIANEASYFDILNNPGHRTVNYLLLDSPMIGELPIGTRLHTQPGISLPISRPGFFVNPRFQLALTNYDLHQVGDSHISRHQNRAVPIFDIASGFSLERDTTIFTHDFQHTLEPQIYYTYIPYRDQSSIPIFDTTVNTLVYDQIFNYNRFSGIDRIGDANQIGVGITSRLIDRETGTEKVRMGIGEIIYFADRRVTLCNGNACSDNPSNHNNEQRLSPISGLLRYNMNASWNMSLDGIWDPITKQLANSTIGFQYRPDPEHVLNLGYSYVFNSNPFSGANVEDGQNNNLKATDISFAWPIAYQISAVGRWRQDWSTNHFQNLMYGVQYDSCCWAVRFVAGRAFTNLSPNYTPQYNSQAFIEFSLKGLGNIGSGNPSGLLSTINGYKPQFGQVL